MSQKTLYERFAPKMLGVCYRYAQSVQEAEDFLQEAFITVFRKLHQFNHTGSLEGWVYRVAVSTSLNGIKARHRFSDDANHVEKLPQQSEEIDPTRYKELMEMVRTLSPGYRTVFNLYAIEGYSHDEIAKMLGIKPGTSRSQYNRAREILISKMSSVPQNKKDGKL